MHNQLEAAGVVRGIDGRGFAFVPRTVVAQPRAFGMAPGLLEPAHDVDVAGERYQAAMLQHVMAVAVRGELLKSEGVTPAVFIARFEGRGLGADRVRRIFRGETMAQLTDLMFWMTQLPAVAVVIFEYIADSSEDGSGSDFMDSADSDIAEELTGTDPAATADPVLGDPEWLAHTRQKELLRQEQEAAGVGPEATRARQELAAKKRGAGAPGARRSPQNPYESSPRRMR